MTDTTDQTPGSDLEAQNAELERQIAALEQQQTQAQVQARNTALNQRLSELQQQPSSSSSSSSTPSSSAPSGPGINSPVMYRGAVAFVTAVLEDDGLELLVGGEHYVRAARDEWSQPQA